MEYQSHHVGRWMSTNLITTAPGSSLADALELMEDKRIRHLPVLEGDDLVGILSSRDAHRVALKPSPGKGHEAIEAAKVSDVMTGGKLHTVDASESIRTASELMCRQKVSALPVTTSAGKVVGLVTTEDMLWAFLEQPEMPDA